MSFKKSLLKNILTLGGYTYGTQITSFLSSIILARLLLPEEYGYVALIIVFYAFFNLFADPGISFSIIRSKYGYTYQRALYNLAFYIGILLFLIMALLAWPISLFYKDPTLIWPSLVISINYIFGSLSIVPKAIILKKLDFNFVGKVRFIANGASIIGMIVLALLGFSYWSLIIPLSFIQIVQFILFDRKVKLGFKFYKLPFIIVAFKKTKSLLLNLSGFMLVNYWSNNADSVIIGKYYSNFDLGIYKRAYKLVLIIQNMIAGLFGTVIYPSLMKHKASGGDFRKEYGSILGVISIITFPLSAIMILIPHELVWLLWGNNWLLVADFLPFFGILIMFQSLMVNNEQIFVLLEKEKTHMYLGIVESIIRVVAIVIGAFFSLKGIVIAKVISYLVLIVPLGLYIGFHKSFNFSSSFIFKFWIPKILLGLIIFIFLIFNNQLILICCVTLYLTHIIYYQRKDLSKLKSILLNRNRKVDDIK